MIPYKKFYLLSIYILAAKLKCIDPQKSSVTGSLNRHQVTSSILTLGKLGQQSIWQLEQRSTPKFFKVLEGVMEIWVKSPFKSYNGSHIGVGKIAALLSYNFSVYLCGIGLLYIRVFG